MLRWLAEMEVDVAVGDEPIDRRASAPVPSPSTSPLLPLRPAEPPLRAPAPAPPLLTSSPQAVVLAAREQAERGNPGGAAGYARAVRGLRLASDGLSPGLRRRRAEGRVMLVGEAPGARRTARDALRRPLRPAARPHARGDRPRPHPGLHRQHRALAAARQPHADAAGGGDLQALHRAADRARRPRHPGLPRRALGPALLGVEEGILRLRGRWLHYDTGERADSARWRRCTRPICCASRCRSASPGATFAPSKRLETKREPRAFSSRRAPAATTGR